MLIVDIADLSSNPSEVLDTALTDEVIVKSKDGTSYRILPLPTVAENSRSPFEGIPYITADITTREIVELIRESRAGLSSGG